VRVLLISGSLREASTNTAALRTLASPSPSLGVPGVEATLYDGLRELPAMDPDDDTDARVVALRAAVGAADAVLFCTPEYAGSLPGSFKNLLDWLVGGGEADGKPMAWISVAPAGRGIGATADLEKVLRYLGARIIEPACRTIPIDRGHVVDGLVTDEAVRTALTDVVAALVAATTSVQGPSPLRSSEGITAR
jgi:NAD(P)H-dependent FMN reductase